MPFEIRYCLLEIPVLESKNSNQVKNTRTHLAGDLMSEARSAATASQGAICYNQSKPATGVMRLSLAVFQQQ